MPKRPGPIWLLAFLLLVGYPAVSAFYFSELLRSGVLDQNADTIAIPVFGNLLATVLSSPFVISVVWLCLRRYNSAARLFAWRMDRPFRSIFATAFFGGAAVFFLWVSSLFVDLDEPWFVHLWALYFVLWVPFLLGLRAALVEQLNGTKADGAPHKQRPAPTQLI